jgi:regulator of protease activity HflC (stomatin/prohibitin superfamily)
MSEFLQPWSFCLLALILVTMGSMRIIRQGYVGVVVRFGKYRKILRPGLNFVTPFMDSIYKKISVQHRSIELEFQAITSDQANVDFKALIIFAVLNSEEETIKRAAFKFVDERSFMQALVRSVEGSIRSYVASKRQNEILALRQDIVHEVNAHIEANLNEWGYHLHSLQINDISFDEAIVRSMAQVVASSNMKAAAENEAHAQYISKTRMAEAEAESLRLIAMAERDADALRGEGNAAMRRNIAHGLVEAGHMLGNAGLDLHGVHYTEWLETMKNVAAHSHGNLLSFDGSMDGFEKTLRQMSLLGQLDGQEAKNRQLLGASSKSV